MCSAPSPDLTGGFTTGVAAGYLVERYLFFTVADTPDQVLDFVTTHPPPHSESNLSGTVGKQRILGFAETGGHPDDAYPGITVAVLPFAGGSAVKVDAQAVITPSRTAAETLPADVVSVDVNLGGSRKNVRSTLVGTAARPIVDAVNALWVGAPVEVAGGPCATDRGYLDQLTFHLSGGHTVKVTASLDCPDPLAYVVADGKVQPMLSGYGTGGPALDTLDDAVVKATHYHPAK